MASGRGVDAHAPVKHRGLCHQGRECDQESRSFRRRGCIFANLGGWAGAGLVAHAALLLPLTRAAALRPPGQLASRSLPNRPIRSQLTSPERGSFKPAPSQAPSNPLKLCGSDNRTKLGVVRLCQRKGPERDGKRPQMGFGAGACGSDKWAGTLAFCGVPAADERREKNVPNSETGGGDGIRTHDTAYHRITV